MSERLSDFDVLHAVRLRGVVQIPALAEMLGVPAGSFGDSLERLTASGAVFERQGRRVGGYALTEEGRAAHAAQLAERAGAVPVKELERVYDSFLDLNSALKTMCGAWQQLGDDVAAKWDAVDRLETLHVDAATVFTGAGARVPRFGRYAERLQAALVALKGGDERYFTSPLVDSYHTVWFEAHEDFLLALGRDRAAEGSF